MASLFAEEPELIAAYSDLLEPPASPNDQTVMEAAREAAAAYPDYADLHCFAARAALRLGKLREADALLRRALELNPRYIQALILSAKLAQAAGDLDRAISCLNRAVAAGAEYPDVFLMLSNLWRTCAEGVRARQPRGRAGHVPPESRAQRDTAAELEAVRPGGERG